MDFLEMVAADIRGMLNGEFSEPIMISDGSNSIVIRGIWETTSEEVDPSTNMIVMINKPSVKVWSPDVPWTIMQDNTVTRRGKKYLVCDVDSEDNPDPAGGVGAVVLYLNFIK